VHQLGVSAFGVYAKNNMEKQQTKLIKQQLREQMERRIKLNILRAEGLVSK
jgi:ATP-dependent Clp protease adapter protein ClpS